MAKILKWVGLIVLLIAAVNVVRIIAVKSKKAVTTPDGKYDVIDGMIGKVALDQFQNVKEKRDSFNIPAFKTGLMMFQTQHGRFPRDMAELESSGDIGRDVTRDQYGNLFQMEMKNNRTVILFSAGKDKIKGTTDDLEFQIQM
ncbi:MAG: hypothetical protein JXR73_16925 [Candidatus Omnitrophica bacterium]|nr:hypothetical protein [Candidatus Omnitrophota bacterium]